MSRSETRVEEPIASDLAAWLAPEALAQGLAISGEQAFLDWAALELVRATDADLVVIGGVVGQSWDRIRSQVVVVDGQIADPLEYDLAGTPCERVLNDGTCLHAEGVAQLFPEDPMLEGFQGYVGSPLVDRTGRPLGVLALVTREPMDVRRGLACLRAFQRPVARHLESLRAMDELELLFQAEAADGPDELQVLVERLSRGLGVRCVLVTSREVPGPAARETIVPVRAIAVDGEARPAFDLSLVNSPCGDLYRVNRLHVPTGLGERYPDCGPVADLNADAYYGEVVRDPAGATIGHYAVLHHKALPEPLSELPLFRAFAARVRSALMRERAERRRAEVERSLVAAQRMESLGVLSGGIAHEFNNLLVGILGNASLAESNLPAGGTARAHLEEVVASASRATERVRELLAYAGKSRFQFKLLDVGTLIRDEAGLLATMVPEGVRVEIEVDRDLPPAAVDSVEFRRVLVHLVVNGGEAYDGEPGRVGLRVRQLDVEAETLARASVGRDLPPGSYLCIEVRDEARGMSSAVLSQALEPFYSTKFAGRGLGLSVVMGVVRGHGGALLVDSAPERGTTARVLLDPRRAEGLRAEGRGSDAPLRSSGAVLVADDDPSVLRTLGFMLRHLGFTPLEARSGQAALDILRRHEDVRLALLDVRMPQMGGHEVHGRIASDWPGLPVVLMSGYAEHEPGDDSSYLRKPFRIAELGEALARAFAGAG